MNILILSFLFAMAMGDSVGIRMAKSLGEGHATRAAFVARLGIIVSLIGGLVIAGQDDIRLPWAMNVQYVDSVLRSTEPQKGTWCQKITGQYVSWERPVFAGVVFAVIPVVVPLMSKDSKPWKLLDSIIQSHHVLASVFSFPRKSGLFCQVGEDPVVQDQMMRLRWNGTVTIALIGGVLPVVTVTWSCE